MGTRRLLGRPRPLRPSGEAGLAVVPRKMIAAGSGGEAAAADGGIWPEEGADLFPRAWDPFGAVVDWSDLDGSIGRAVRGQG